MRTALRAEIAFEHVMIVFFFINRLSENQGQMTFQVFLLRNLFRLLEAKSQLQCKLHILWS